MKLVSTDGSPARKAFNLLGVLCVGSVLLLAGLIAGGQWSEDICLDDADGFTSSTMTSPSRLTVRCTYIGEAGAEDVVVDHSLPWLISDWVVAVPIVTVIAVLGLAWSMFRPRAGSIAT